MGVGGGEERREGDWNWVFECGGYWREDRR